MERENQLFRIPLMGEEAYNFEAKDEDVMIYEELNAINEEIEQCRSRNC